MLVLLLANGLEKLDRLSVFTMAIALLIAFK